MEGNLRLKIDWASLIVAQTEDNLTNTMSLYCLTFFCDCKEGIN